MLVRKSIDVRDVREVSEEYRKQGGGRLEAATLKSDISEIRVWVQEKREKRSRKRQNVSLLRVS